MRHSKVGENQQDKADKSPIDTDRPKVNCFRSRAEKEPFLDLSLLYPVDWEQQNNVNAAVQDLQKVAFDNKLAQDNRLYLVKLLTSHMEMFCTSFSLSPLSASHRLRLSSFTTRSPSGPSQQLLPRATLYSEQLRLLFCPSRPSVPQLKLQIGLNVTSRPQTGCTVHIHVEHTASRQGHCQVSVPGIESGTSVDQSSYVAILFKLRLLEQLPTAGAQTDVRSASPL